ncbi:microtubule-associated tumor suppressor 1 homolog [Battus philenor]|uniref:microtubule-associated tumor suppressor 1 homolog n=1 Tax=Battus philenor TaxID=42288 RepID=UPI0035CFEBB9
MDIDDKANLDVEYKRYLQILKPYLGQLLDPEDIETCNAWIKRLSNCEKIEKYRRNKYLFTLCFQLANGVLKHPFTSHPRDELPDEIDDINSDDSFSEVESHVTCYNQNKGEEFSKEVFKNIFQGDVNLTATTSEIKANIEEDKAEIRILKNPNGNLLASSNSTITNNQYYPEILKDLSNFVHSEDNVYQRVNNLVDKLRDIKKQNTILQKELQAIKEESNNKKESNTSSQNNKLQAHCATNTTISIEDTEEIGKFTTCDCKSYIFGSQSQQDKINNLEKLEELKRKHEIELIELRKSIREEIQDFYENKLQTLKEEQEFKLKEIKTQNEAEIEKLKSSINDLKSENQNILSLKDQEIKRLQIELEEARNQNVAIKNSFIKARNDCNSEMAQEKALEFEKRLYKIEKAKNKRVKAYQAQLASLQHNKNILDSSFHLQILKHRSELITEFAQENQKEMLTAIEKLEGKYKEMVAGVQAAAIQRRIQDQIALDTIIQTVLSNDSCLPQEGSHNNINPDKKQKTDKEPYTSLQLYPRDKRVGKKVNLEDSVLSGFCMDEVKLEELFEQVHIPQKDTGDN